MERIRGRVSVRHLAPDKRLIAGAGLVGAMTLGVSSFAWHFTGGFAAGVAGWLIELLMPRL